MDAPPVGDLDVVAGGVREGELGVLRACSGTRGGGGGMIPNVDGAGAGGRHALGLAGAMASTRAGNAAGSDGGHRIYNWASLR